MTDIAALDKACLPGVRRAGGVEPGEAAAGLPVLRHGVAVHRRRRTGALVEIDLAKALRELPDEARGWQTEKRTVQCQSCKAVSVFDPERVGQNCEFCGSPALVDYKEIKAPIRPQSLLPFKVTRERRSASRSAAGTRASGSRRAKLKTSRARRSRPRRLHPVLDVRRAGGLPVGSRGGPLLLHDRDLPRQPGPHADAPGAARPLGAGVRRRRALLRRRAGAGHAGVSHALLRAGRAVSHDRARALRHRVSLRLRRRALSGRAARRGAGVAGRDDRQAAASCAPSRFPATPIATCEIHPTFSGQTFKHILVPVWLLSYTLRHTNVPGGGQRLHGRMAGQYPKSPWKIALLVLLAIIVFMIVVMLNQNN